ncbi:MAG: YdbH domain-containing protein [Chlorobiaceae bacterium]|nr:YdbH domain-containing protein [Chlorobiaceae bacterium]
MKWVLRILAALVLLLLFVLAGAWVSFPWYAQALLDRLTAGTGASIELREPGRPGFSGIGFRQLDATVTTKPDSCSTTASTYSVRLRNGRLSWQPIGKGAPAAFALRLDADLASVRQSPSGIRFSQPNPSLHARIDVTETGGLFPAFAPDSVTVKIRNGLVEAGQLRLEKVSYDVLLARSNGWVQQPARFRASSLLSGDVKTPVSDLEATFGLKRSPAKPCTLIFTDCALELSGVRVYAPQIEFNLRNRHTAFELKLDDVPLEQLSPDSGPLGMTGRLSGSIPVEYLDPAIRIGNATIDAAKGTKLVFKTGTTSVIFDAGGRQGAAPLLGSLRARLGLETEKGELSAITLDSLSARFFDGRISSAPARYDLKTGTAATAFSISNVPLPGRISLQGEFSGKMKGRLSGSIPVRLDRNGVAITNARLTVPGSNSILQTPPVQPGGDDALFSKTAGSREVQWEFSDTAVRLNREVAGKMTIAVTLKSLKRKTGGGELLLTSPKGTLTMFARPEKPSLFTVSGFSAGLLGGTVAVEKMDYDLERKHAETLVQLNGIPIQSLLEMQGTSKLSATGTIRGALPVVLDNNLFSIPEGSMDAEKNGLIIYSTTPEERAAAGAGMRLTYEALGNFFYSELLSTITMAPDGNSTITIQLKGRNPDFQNNRPVNLNLNIQQNLLDLFRSLTLSSEIERAISEKVLEKSGGKKEEK